TIHISAPHLLPLRDLPVVAFALLREAALTPEAVAAEVRRALRRADLDDRQSPAALAFSWHGDPSHARLHAVAAGICAAMDVAMDATMRAGLPLVLMIDGDVARNLG